MDTVRLGLAQINVRVGDVEGNLRKILGYIKDARAEGGDILCFPELGVTGYPPADPLWNPRFINDNLKAVDNVAEAAYGNTGVKAEDLLPQGLLEARQILHNKQL